MAYEVPVALIGGGAGFLTGTLSSLFAPWANWGIEKRKLLRSRRTELISEWRSGIAELRQIEHEVAPLIPVPGPPNSAGFMIRHVPSTPDPVEADINQKAWYSTLRQQMDSETRTLAEQLRSERICDRKRSLPDLLAEEVVRLEAQWNLI